MSLNAAPRPHPLHKSYVSVVNLRLGLPFAIEFAPSALADARAASDYDPGLLQRASEKTEASDFWRK